MIKHGVGGIRQGPPGGVAGEKLFADYNSVTLAWLGHELSCRTSISQVPAAG